MKLKIAHLSDPHFGTILPGVREGLIASLKERAPDLILLTGDITQRARRKQFAEARQFTQSLSPIPFIAVPGNHDIPLFNLYARVFHPYRGFKRLFKDHLEQDFRHGDVLVMGLNSTSQWRHVQGDFNLPRLERRLKEGTGKAKLLVAAFHHPVDCAKPADEKNLLKGRNEAMRLFDKYGVDLVMGGHIHDPYVTLSGTRYPDVPRSMVLAVAGTSLSSRTRSGASNSFNWIEVDTTATPTIAITRFDRGEDFRYEPSVVSRFVRGEGGWAVL